MNTATVRTSREAKQILEELARELKQSQASVLEKALRLLKNHLKFARGRAAYAALRQDESAWKKFKGERDAWDAALLHTPEEETSGLRGTWRGPTSTPG